MKKCIIKNNGGRPPKTTFDLGNNKEKVFGGLLSFNKDDANNFYSCASVFEKEDGKGLRMFPFAIDPAGNFFCVENGNIVFYDHETDTTKTICGSFTEFLKKLY